MCSSGMFNADAIAMIRGSVSRFERILIQSPAITRFPSFLVSNPDELPLKASKQQLVGVSIAVGNQRRRSASVR
jgi:hypothetical protein